MKIKCIMPDAVDLDLTYGKIYDVNRVDKRLAEPSYCVIDDVGDGSYMKEGEFEVVEEYWYPPHGTVCEYISNDTSWGNVEIIGMDGDKVVFKPSGDKYYSAEINHKSYFRPTIKSQKDKEIEELGKDIDYFVATSPGNEDVSLQEYLHSIGYRKTQ